MDFLVEKLASVPEFAEEDNMSARKSRFVIFQQTASTANLH